MKFDRDILKTGVPLIDRQHEEYFRLVEEVFELLERGEMDRAKLNLEVNKAIGYAVQHFDAEEHLMLSIRYPDYEVHAAKHGLFRDKMNYFIDQMNGDMPDEALANQLGKWLVEWFSLQILTDDRQLARFINRSSETVSRENY